MARSRRKDKVLETNHEPVILGSFLAPRTPYLGPYRSQGHENLTTHVDYISQPAYNTKRMARRHQESCFGKLGLKNSLRQGHFFAFRNRFLGFYTRLFFVHFSAGQFRPKACGALSFEGEKLSFRSKNTSFFHKGSFFCNFLVKKSLR